MFLELNNKYRMRCHFKMDKWAKLSDGNRFTNSRLNRTTMAIHFLQKIDFKRHIVQNIDFKKNSLSNRLKRFTIISEKSEN